MTELPILKIIICKKNACESQEPTTFHYIPKNPLPTNTFCCCFAFVLLLSVSNNFFFLRAPTILAIRTFFFYLWMKQNIDFLMTSSSSFPQAFFSFFYILFFFFVSLYCATPFFYPPHHFSPYNFSYESILCFKRVWISRKRCWNTQKKMLFYKTLNKRRKMWRGREKINVAPSWIFFCIISSWCELFKLPFELITLHKHFFIGIWNVTNRLSFKKQG